MRSVAEVASQMKVSPERVRQLIASGALPAVRVGGRWVVGDRGVVRRPDGRPWNEAAAWGLLWFASGRPAPWLSVKQRQRVRARIGEGLAVHVERLAARGTAKWFRAHPASLIRLGRDTRLVRTGLSAAAEAGADLVVADRVEGYVRSVDGDLLIAEYGLESAQVGEGNVQLRLVGDVWPFAIGELVAPTLVVALDLVEQPDERTKRAGQLLLDRAIWEVRR